MNFPPYQNAGAGLGALGPVQAMSDRNEAQTLMTNGGQMFAGGGIAMLAKGGLPKYTFDPKTQSYVLEASDDTKSDDTGSSAASKNLLPKYVYDPKTQQYKLEEAKADTAASAAPTEKMSDGASPNAPSGWDKMSSAEKAAYYAANPTMAAITQMGQKAFGMTGLGLLSRAVDPIAWGERSMEARGVDPAYMGQLNAQVEQNAGLPGFNAEWGGGLGNTLGDQPGDYGTPSSDGFTGADSNGGFSPSTSGELAKGGIASLAGGGQINLQGTIDMGGDGGGRGGQLGQAGYNGYRAAGSGFGGNQMAAPSVMPSANAFGGGDMANRMDIPYAGGGDNMAVGMGGTAENNFRTFGGFGANQMPVHSVMPSRDPFEGDQQWAGHMSAMEQMNKDLMGTEQFKKLQGQQATMEAYQKQRLGSDYGRGRAFAEGGLSALAQGGQSHLGDYSDGGRLLRGPGDGVSDSIPATIANKRPARLADGEFVVPARIVSELGNGSTEAGARKLYAMMDRVQKARTKTVGKDRVAVNSRADKNLPA